jgi:outer membrane receptor protein involved in Fe transport
LLLLFVACPFLLYAQEPGIKGVVKDAGKNTPPIAGASINLIRKSDSVLVKSTVSDPNGNFELSHVLSGHYRLVISVIGYYTYILNDLAVNNSSITLDDIRLTVDPGNLKEVEVISKKALVVQESGKVVVNVDASVTNVGSNALEVLMKSPGVSVDKDGNISLRGKQGVTVMIDGKPSYLSGGDLVKLLSSMNASQLNQIEIIVNPTAKFDAAGNAGIINLKTKKNTAYGFNGMVTLGFGQGSYWRTDNSINLNYRNKSINAFVNYGFSVRNGFNELDIKRSFFNKDNGNLTSLYEQPSLQTFQRKTNNLKVGMDYFISPKTTIGFVLTGQLSPIKIKSNSNAYFEDVNSVVDSSVNSRSNTENRFKNGSVNLNLEHRFDSAKTLTADLDYLHYPSENPQLFKNTSYSPSGEITAQDGLKGNLPVDIDVYSGKLDYSQTFRNDLKMETGAKVSQVNTNNVADYSRSYSGSDVFVPDYSISNTFKYKENINALYLNFTKQIKKWNVQAGLRFENTNYKGHQLGNPEKDDSAFTRNYNNLFPTAAIAYKFNDDNEINFSFGRRIDRPAYQSLNPFLYFINKYTYEVGNPLLRPQYSNNFNLGYLFKGKFNASVNYSEISNYFSTIFRTENSVTIYTQDNLQKLRTVGLSLSEELEVSKWWNVSMSGNITYKKVAGFVNGENLVTEAYTYLLEATNQFTIAKGLSAELSGFYNSRDVDGQFTTKDYGQVSFGISKQLLNNKATLKLNARDLFYFQVIHGSILYNNVKETYVQSSDTRVVNLSFTYRFGKKPGEARRKSRSVEQEQDRIRN